MSFNKRDGGERERVTAGFTASSRPGS